MERGGSFIVRKMDEGEIFTVEKFSEEQREIADLISQFGKEQILPKRKDIEKHDKELSVGLMRQLGELGLLSVDVPEEYDGLGMDKVTSAIIAEKVVMGESASFTVTFSAHTGIGTLPIVFFGTEEQKKKYLPKLGSGEWIGAYALTEPNSGSDALAAKTTAVLSEDGKYYILNGTKQFISNGAWCDMMIAYAQVDGDKFTAFLVEMDMPGVEVGPEEVKMGLKGSSTTSIIFNNAKIPVENVLGIVGKGHHIAFNILNIGRYKLGASDLGGCKVTINEAVGYAMERHQFGQAISNFDSIKSKFANMIVRTFEQESILYRMVKDIDTSIKKVKPDDKDYYKRIVAAIEEYAIEASMAKIVGSEALWLNADDGLQIFGGYGFTEDYPLAGITRDTRVDRIFEGTNEINRQIVTGYFLKKALTEELPIREKIKEVKAMLGGKTPQINSDVLKEEKSAYEYAKAVTLYLFNESIIKYGQGLKNEQQLMEILADSFTDLYIIDSVLRRITQNEKRDQDRLAIGKISTAVRVRRIVGSAKVALLSILDGDELDKALDDLTTLSKGTELRNNLFALKRQLAESLYDKGEYVW